VPVDKTGENELPASIAYRLRARLGDISFQLCDFSVAYANIQGFCAIAARPDNADVPDK
jgi:hypothetical protein